MHNYQIWGFTYLNYGKKNVNAITGDKNESDEEFNVPCFDGIAWFASNGNYYIAYYPKYKELTGSMIDIIEDYCGYKPEEGEYGVIMGALGIIRKVSKEMFDMTVAAYPVTTIDEDNLG